jgi:hypothetical protein
MPLGDFKYCDCCGQLFEAGSEDNDTCASCVHGESDVPEEGDLVTEDHRRFYEIGGTRGPALVVGEHDDWRQAVMAHMDAQQFWPNLWFRSDHGNMHQLLLSR